MSGAPRPTAIATAVLLLLVGGWLFGLARAGRADTEAAHALRKQALRLAHANACRRAELELAKGEGFYLVLDPERRSLSLKLRGTILREVALDSIEIGRPQRFFFERDTPDEVRGRVHRQGRLAPRRPLLRLPVEVLGNPDEEAQTIMLPPEPETAIAVPRRFFIHYDGGVALEFRTDAGGLGMRQRVADGFSTLFGRRELRLRLGLDRVAAEEFFRSVPRDTDLLVL